MAAPLNVAAPLPTVVAVAFVSVAPAGPEAITAVTGTPAPPAGLPAPSRTWSTGCGVNAAPLAAVGEGSVVIVSVAAAPAASVYPVPTRLMLSVEKVATPFTAATVAVPDRVPPAGLAPIATLTFPVNPMATFPTPSSAVTRTAGVIVAPAVVLLGCTVNTSWVAVTVAMFNNALFPPVSPDEVARSR